MYAKIKKKKKTRGGFTHKLEDIPEHIQQGLIYGLVCDGQAVGSEIYTKIQDSKILYQEWYAEKEKEHF
jgi:hypothetical protein